MAVDNTLIYDIGLHTGNDSAFYLQKGFKVIGIEANPVIADVARRSLEGFVSDGRLQIVEKAIFERPDETVTFFVNDEKDDWSSLFQGVAEKGVTTSRPITVPTTTLTNLFATYGVPYYLKCDIEGGDELVASQMLHQAERPTFVSFEITSIGLLGMLYSAGYRKFQLINQAFNYLTLPPEEPREGLYIAHRFDGHASGLFGKELKETRWVDIDEVTGLFMDFIRLRDRYEQFCMGWLDVHATT